MSYLVDKRPLVYRNPWEIVLAIHMIFFFFLNNLLWICIFNTGFIESELEKKGTKMSVYSSLIGVKLSSVASVSDENVLRLLKYGLKG